MGRISQFLFAQLGLQLAKTVACKKLPNGSLLFIVNEKGRKDDQVKNKIVLNCKKIVILVNYMVTCWVM